MAAGTTILIGIGASPGIAIGRCWPVDRRRVRTPKRRLGPDEVEPELARFRVALEISDQQLEEVRQKVSAAEGERRQRAHRHHRHPPAHAQGRDAGPRGAEADPRGAAQRRVGGQAGGPQDQGGLRRRRRRVLQGAARRRRLRRRAGHQEPARPAGGRGGAAAGGGHHRGPRPLPGRHRRCCSTSARWGPSSPTPGPRPATPPSWPAPWRCRRWWRSGASPPWPTRATGSSSTAPAAWSSSTPPPGERADYEAARERFLAHERELLRTRDLPAATQDGVTVRLAGNIEFAEEVPSLLTHGGEAVGLYRTEFLYLQRDRLPTEEEHYQDYRRVLEALAPRAGHHPHLRPGRRQAAGRPAGPRREPGPGAAGHPLLPAPARHVPQPSCAACCGPRSTATCGIMFPMISGVAELRAAKRVLVEVREELAARGAATCRCRRSGS